MGKEITGVLYSYYYLCKRKLWLASHDINFEDYNENVQIGKLIDEQSFSRERKHVMIDGKANIDFIRNDVVYEVKKSDRELQMGIEQVKYYLYLLRSKTGRHQTGVVSVPEKHINIEVLLEDADIESIEEKLNEIESIIEALLPPESIRIPACKKCAYYEFCYV